MERTISNPKTEVEVDGEFIDVKDGKFEPITLPRWRKTGGGSFRMANGRIIKKNQVFHAAPDQIPESFRNVVVPVDGVEEKPVEIVDPSYTIESGTPGYYNVVDTNGKKMNEKQLRQDAAQEMVEALLA